MMHKKICHNYSLHNNVITDGAVRNEHKNIKRFLMRNYKYLLNKCISSGQFIRKFIQLVHLKYIYTTYTNLQTLQGLSSLVLGLNLTLCIKKKNTRVNLMLQPGGFLSVRVIIGEQHVEMQMRELNNQATVMHSFIKQKPFSKVANIKNELSKKKRGAVV